MRPMVLALISIAWLAPALTSSLVAQISATRDGSQAYQPDTAVVTRAAPPEYIHRSSHDQGAGPAGHSASPEDQAWTAAPAAQRSSDSQFPTALPASPAVPLPELVRPTSGSASVSSYVAQAQFTSSDPPPLGGRSEVGRLPVAREQPPGADGAADGPPQRPLKPPTSTDLASQSKRSGGTMQTLVSVISSLLIVVGLLLGAAWCYRKAAPSISGSLPKQVVQVLGRTALAPRQQLVLVRFGPKLILVSNLQGEVRTISEITDPLEVDRVAGLCESAQSGSISDSFRTVLHNIGRNG